MRGAERHVYVVLHKPKGTICHHWSAIPESRPTVLELVRGVMVARVYPRSGGWISTPSEGPLLLTNDGELAQKLIHASSHVPKTYLVKISGKASDAEIDKLRGGIKLPAERSRLKVPEGKLHKTAQRRPCAGADGTCANQVAARGRQSVV